MQSKLYDIWKPGELLLLDGAMGTVLQQKGLAPGDAPELLNLSHPEWLSEIYRSYIAAGSRVIYTNTFGANALKLSRTGKSVEEIVSAAVRIAKEAVQQETAQKEAVDRSNAVCVVGTQTNSLPSGPMTTSPVQIVCSLSCSDTENPSGMTAVSPFLSV